jgi:hypothetical protein
LVLDSAVIGRRLAMAIEFLIVVVTIIIILIIAIVSFVIYYRSFYKHPVRSTLRVCVSSLALGLGEVVTPKPDVAIPVSLNFKTLVIGPARIALKGPNDLIVLAILGLFALIVIICLAKTHEKP